MLLSENIYIQEFLNYLSFQKRYSQNTIISYQNDLEAFFMQMGELYLADSPQAVTTVMIRTWLAGLKEKNRSSRSVNRKISALKSFFKYFLKKQIISINPAATLHSLKTGRRLPSFVEEPAITKMMERENFEDSREGALQRIILEILYQTGIRRNELIQLKDADINFSGATLKVLGKGNKERLVPIGPRLIRELREYMAHRNKEFGTGTEYLLVTAKGKKLYPKYVYNVVNRHLKTVTTIERKSPHVLRHTFATHLTNNGAEINGIKELLGHSSLAATQIYTHNTIEKLKEVHKLAHPKS